MAASVADNRAPEDTLLGVDGDYVDRESLEIPPSTFTAVDLNKPFDLNRRFDLVQSLEAGEHVDHKSSELFVETLLRHSKSAVLFSAAPPGQGGESHVNEQPYDFWRAIFKRHGFLALDCVRPAIGSDVKISYWYRYNIFLYVHRDAIPGLAPLLRSCQVPDGVLLRDNSPALFLLRKMVVKRLPFTVQNRIARFKARRFRSGRI